MRKAKFIANFYTSLALITGIIIFINLLSIRYFKRLDFTEGKDYTLSKATKKIIKNIEDIMSIEVYFSKKLPPYLVHIQQQVKDMLDEYKAFSRDKIKVKFLDPTTDPKLEEKVQRLGIPPVQLNVIEKDQRQAIKAYLGLVVFYEDRKEIIPLVQDITNFEYDLSTIIKKITLKELKTIGFLTGHNEPDIYKELNNFRMELEKEYKVTTVNIKDSQVISNDIETLIAVGTKGIEEKELFEIDQLLMQGKKLILLLDSIERPEGGLYAKPAKSGFEDYLSFYGVNLNEDLVLDSKMELASFNSGLFTFTVPYPFFVRVDEDGLDTKSPIVGKIRAVVFPWTQSISLNKNTISSHNLKVNVIAKSSKNSWTQSEFFNLSPQQNFQISSAKKGERNLICIITGKLKSYFSNKGKPIGIEDSRTLIKEGNKEAIIIVAGSSNIILDNFSRMFPANQAFFLNLIEWATVGEGLREIRMRAIADRPIKTLSEAEKSKIRFINILIVPLIIVIYGIIKANLVRKRKFIYSLKNA